MQKIVERRELTPIAIYSISSHLTYLRLATNNRWNVVFEDRAVYNRNGNALILGSMIWLKDLLNELKLCQNEIYLLENLIKEFEEFYTNPNNPTKLTDYHAHELSKLIARIEGVLVKELNERKLVEVSLSGTLNYHGILINGFSELFSDKKILEKLSDLVKNDLNEAVRALLHNIPTASAIISLRAVEGAIRDLYKALKGENCNKTWRDALYEVERELKSKNLESKKLGRYLDYIREIRNEAGHPDRIFTKKESEYILMHAIYAIEEIYKIIEKIQTHHND